MLTCKTVIKISWFKSLQKLLEKKTSITTFDIKITSDDQNSVTTSTETHLQNCPFTVTGLNKLKIQFQILHKVLLLKALNVIIKSFLYFRWFKVF